MRATPPCARMSAGTRSSAMTETAPASSAIRACSASTTSMITPPLSISARPLLTRIVPVSCSMRRAIATRRRRPLRPARPGRRRRRRARRPLPRPRLRRRRRLLVVLVVRVVVVVELDRHHVRLAGGQVEAFAVVEVDDDGGDLVSLDQELVEVDHGRLLVILPVLGARDEHALAHEVAAVSVIGAMLASGRPGTRLPCYRWPTRSIPPRRPGVTSARQASSSARRSTAAPAAAAKAGAAAPPPPPPPPPAVETHTFVGRCSGSSCSRSSCSGCRCCTSTSSCRGERNVRLSLAAVLWFRLAPADNWKRETSGSASGC